MNELNRYRVAIQFAIARLHGGNDDEDGEKDEADKDEAKAAPTALWISIEI